MNWGSPIRSENWQAEIWGSHPTGWCHLVKGHVGLLEMSMQTKHPDTAKESFFLWNQCSLPVEQSRELWAMGGSSITVSLDHALHSHCGSPESWKRIAFLPVQDGRGSVQVLWGKNSDRRINLEGTEVGKIGLNYSTTSEIKHPNSWKWKL